MTYKSRALAVLVLVLLIAVACSRTRGQRVSEGPPPATASPSATAPPSTSAPSSSTAAVAPIPGHPPITTTGVVAKIDPATGVVVFQDGRTVKLTDRSKVLTPVDLAAVRPGTPVVVRNAVPVATPSTRAAGKRQRMGTVASVDQQNQLVRLTDGTSLRVKDSTNMHMGTQGATIILTDLRPGDELVIVMADEAPTASGTSTSAASPTTPGTSAMPGAATTPGSRSSADPSALPRSVVTGAPSDPSDISELMVFREVQAP
jgi:hypothetical protein